MGPERHRWRRSAFKCILSVIGLALFTAQLSYKFYLFANSPVIQSGRGSTTHSVNVKGHPSIPNYHTRVHLLLDKRYDYKHTYALVTPVFQVQHFPQNSINSFSILPVKVITTANWITFFRGPPAISVS